MPDNRGGILMEDNLNNAISPEEADPVLDAPVSLDDLEDDVTEEPGEADDDMMPDNEEDIVPEDMYTYDESDDEPVDDKDLYRDYTSELPRVRPSAPEQNVVSASSKSEDVHTAAENVQSSVKTSGMKAIAVYENTSDYQDTKQNVKINRIFVVNTVISMFTLCAVAAGIFTGYAYLKKLETNMGLNQHRISKLEDSANSASVPEKEEDEYVDAMSRIEEEELTEPAVPESEDYVNIEKGKLLLYDSYVGYSWVPIIAGVKPHSYIKENFHVDNDYRMEYVVDGEVSSYFGIDVSSYQGDIDWDAVRSDGVEFAILRIGVRGYGEEGNIKIDDKFFQNYDGARKAGLDIGVYFYSQAISVEEAVEEAKFVLEQLGDRKLEYPIVFDWEPVDASTSDSPPRTEDIMPGTLTLCAVAFCETIRDAGYEAMIYTNKKMAYIKYDMRKFADYPVWLALYNTDLTYYYDFDMWQYGFGKVDGIEGDVDLDIAMIR